MRAINSDLHVISGQLIVIGCVLGAILGCLIFGLWRRG